MEIQDRLSARLRPLRLYRLDGSTLVDAELAAYAAGLAVLENILDTLEQELFVSTAQDYGLALREQLFGGVKQSLPLSDRREMLLYRGGITAADCTREGIERAVAAAGVRCAIQENRPDGVLYLNCMELLNPFTGRDAVQKAAQDFLPAHLQAQFDFRDLSWDAIDARGLDFDGMDAAGRTWDQIDQFEEEIWNAHQS